MSSTKIKRTHNPFEAEQLRSEFASSQDKEFLKFYSSSFAEIKDINTNKFWNKKFNSKNNSEDGPMADDRNRIVAKEISKLSGRMLDVGFGEGKIEKILQKKKDIDLYGIDISDFAIKKVKQEVIGIFKKGDILKIPFENNYFDIVIALEVLEHIPPARTFGALNELKRVLRNNGTLIVSVPTNEGLEEMVEKGENPNGHVRAYTANILKKELEIKGFMVKKIVFLSAFKHYYFIKKLVSKFIKRWEPNNIIIVAEKR